MMYDKFQVVDWSCDPWPKNETCRSFCQSLLAKRRRKRPPRVEDALKHEWFANMSEPSRPYSHSFSSSSSSSHLPSPKSGRTPKSGRMIPSQPASCPDLGKDTLRPRSPKTKTRTLIEEPSRPSSVSSSSSSSSRASGRMIPPRPGSPSKSTQNQILIDAMRATSLDTAVLNFEYSEKFLGA